MNPALRDAARAVVSAQARLELALEERDRLILEARAGGFSLRAIAAEAGITHQQVANVCADDRAGVRYRPLEEEAS